MKRTTASIAALAFVLSAGSAIAAENVIVNNETGEGLFSTAIATKSRDEVRAELAEAVRAGDVIVNNATGETARATIPGRYVPSFEAGLTREQVKAELAAAVRSGDLIANNVTGETFSQRYPDRYAHVAVPGKAS